MSDYLIALTLGLADVELVKQGHVQWLAQVVLDKVNAIDQEKRGKLTCYQEIIAQSTGLKDREKIDQVEQYMRHVYFHSTLSWQTRPQLARAARESAEELGLIGEAVA